MLRGILFTLLVAPALMFAGMAKGEKLVRKFFKELKEQEFNEIEEHTASYFLGVDSSGSFNKAARLLSNGNAP